jgi:hypothetical protein
MKCKFRSQFEGLYVLFHGAPTTFQNDYNVAFHIFIRPVENPGNRLDVGREFLRSS